MAKSCGRDRRAEMRTIPAAVLAILVGGSGVFAQDQQPSLADLIAIVHGTNSVRSAEAVTAIGKLRPASDLAIQTLVDSLADDRRAVRIPKSIPITFPVETVGSTAAKALTEIGKPAVPSICKLLSSSQDKNVRILAIRSLTKMEGDAATALPVLQQLLNDSEMEIRFDAVAAVVSIQKDTRALSYTLGPVLLDKSPDVRAAAIRALGNLGKAGSGQIPSLVKLLDDSEDRWHFLTPDMTGTLPVRYDAAMSLAETGQDGRVALAKLREMMNNDSDTLVRVGAAYAVAKLDDVPKDALDHLVESVRDRQSGSRVPEAAAQSLGRLGPKAAAAIPALVDATKHPEVMVRIYAIEAIALIAPESAERRLLPTLRDEDALVRASAIEALGSLRKASPQLIKSYIAALDDDDWLFGSDVRRAAAVALGNLQGQAAVALPRLKRLLQEEDCEGVKDAAAEAVRRISQGQSGGDRPTP